MAARIVGIDVARGTAVLGMFVAHLAVPFPGSWLFDGRPSALFALLAGTGLGLMTRHQWRDRAALRAQYPRIGLRSACLYLLGIGLMLLATPIVVILGSYAVMFALMIPFLRLRPGLLLAWAAGILVVMPPLVQAIRILVNGAPESAYGPPGLFELATGHYPALIWVAYLLVGLAVSRLDLGSRRTCLWLLGAGAAAMIAGYALGAGAQQVVAEDAEYVYSLISVEPHTDSGPEVLSNIGTAVVVIALALLITSGAVGRWLLRPLATVGMLTLTLYSAHIGYIAVLGQDAVWYPTSQGPLLALIAGSVDRKSVV